MVNERYESHQENPEESEYHFSDDQVNYELESESYKDGAPVAAAKPGLVEKLKENRRAVIGGLVFFVLLVLVYKMLTPSTPPVPTTDIAQQTLPPAAKPVAKPVATVQAVPAQPVAPVQTTQPAPAAPVTTPAAMPQSQADVAAVAPAPVAAPSAVAQAAQTQQPAVIVQAAAPVDAAMPAKPMEQPAAADQQSTVLMNMMQSQYSQKMAEQEAQVNDMKTQMQELNARVAGMEVAFRQLTKILRNMRGAGDGTMAAASNDSAGAASVQAGASAGGKVASRFNYTVQAIIPGRAWLKSDSGDTVTVAEGDILKEVGRVTKIDPYDGIVKIDTGRKIITLSYGVAGD